MVGELIEADHILFQVTPGVNLDMLRAHAKVVLDELMADPSRFAEVARASPTVRRPRSAAAWASSGAATRCRSSSAPCSPSAGGLLPQLLKLPPRPAHRARHAPHRRAHAGL